MTDETNDAEPGKPRILIVSADHDLRNVLYYIVHKQGFPVEEAENLAEALQSARRLQPALVLLDLPLKGGPGFATLRALQEEDETRRIPVAVLCDNSPGNFQKQLVYQECNVKAALEKPFSAESLLAMLGRLLHEGPEHR